MTDRWLTGWRAAYWWKIYAWKLQTAACQQQPYSKVKRIMAEYIKKVYR